MQFECNFDATSLQIFMQFLNNFYAIFIPIISI